MWFLGCVFALYLTACAAQHHYNPWAGSGCTCDTFCQNKCAINATEPKNVSFYRMTPFGAWDMNNKDTGDAKGDTSFVLSRKTAAYQCRKDPDSFQCKDVTQFTGDDPNSTDVIQEFKIEIDGQWGPYLYCNPVNVSAPTGPWACTVELGTHGGPTPPPQCKANFSLYGGYCFTSRLRNVTADDLGACCDAASEARTEHFSFIEKDKVCSLSESYYPRYEKCAGGVAGVGSHHESVCNCTRVHKTIGREDLESAMGGHSSSHHPAGGFWFSHPEQGRCTGDQRVGDGSGCTWRVVERVRAVKASCMYKRLDERVEAEDPNCF